MRAWTLHLGFLVVGTATVAIGPLLPSLAGRLGVAPEALGVLFVAQFGGVAVGSLLSPLRILLSVRLGYVLVTTGMLGLGHGSWSLAVAGAASVGLGLGLVGPATNLLVAFRNPGRRGAKLSVLNLIWGLGAVSAPLLLAALPRESRAWLGPWILACVAGALALLTLLPARGRADSVPGDPRRAALARPAPGGGRFRLPDRRAIGLTLLLALYIAAETSVGGWLVPATAELPETRDVEALTAAAVFWSALLAGRAAAPWLLRALTESRLHVLSLGLATIGVGALLAAQSWRIYLGAAGCAGLGLAAMFPLTVSRIAHATQERAGRGSGWMFAVGGLGGAFGPWLAAQVAAGAGQLRYAFSAPLAALVGIALLLAADPRHRAEGGP